jgi:acetyl esterase/lipase
MKIPRFLRRAAIPALALPALALLAALPGCSPAALLNATVSEQGLAVARAVPYGPAPRQALDIWRPATSAENLPVVVFFYGGAWQNGERQDYTFVAANLARRGHVVVVPDYRVHGQAPYPTFLQDAAAAVAAARRLAPDHGGDPARLVLMGHSAGAHIAAMLALDPRWLEAAGEDRARIAGLVGLAGPYDFLPIVRRDIIAVFAPAADARETQPVTFADRNAPPALLLHGRADTTVLPRNSQSLAERLAAAGAPATLRLYDGVGHVGIVLGFARLTRATSPALDDAAGFIATLAPRG